MATTVFARSVAGVFARKSTTTFASSSSSSYSTVAAAASAFSCYTPTTTTTTTTTAWQQQQHHHLFCQQQHWGRRRGLHCTTSGAASSRRYTESHEWVSLSDNGEEATVGITDYAQNALGDIVYVELPDVGEELDVEDEFGAIESVKAASELYSPVSGTVAAVNEALNDKPGLINTQPDTDGWIVRIAVASKADFENLLDEEAYAELCKGEPDEE